MRDAALTRRSSTLDAEPGRPATSISFLRGLVPADRVRWASVPGEQLRPEPRLSPVANRPEPARRSRHVFGRDRKPDYEFFPVDRTHSACRSQDVLDSTAFAYQVLHYFCVA